MVMMTAITPSVNASIRPLCMHEIPGSAAIYKS
jgi:hypothetical protein